MYQVYFFLGIKLKCSLSTMGPSALLQNPLTYNGGGPSGRSSLDHKDILCRSHYFHPFSCHSAGLARSCLCL